MLLYNEVSVTVYGINGLSDQPEYVCITQVGVDAIPIAPEGNEDERLYWAHLRFDDVGLYFRHPDMAKHISMDKLGEEYRSHLDTMKIASMNGYERALLKAKKNKDEDEPLDFLTRHYFWLEK